MKWIEIDLDINVLEEGIIHTIDINSKHICIVKHKDLLYAVHAKCPHAGGAMVKGWCENGNIICPVHRHAFDLQSGKSSNGKGDYLPIYPTKMVDNKLFIGFKTGFWDKIF